MADASLVVRGTASSADDDNGRGEWLEMASDGEVRGDAFFEQFDSDGDGALQLQEFVDMILAIVKLNGRRPPAARPPRTRRTSI